LPRNQGQTTFVDQQGWPPAAMKAKARDIMMGNSLGPPRWPPG